MKHDRKSLFERAAKYLIKEHRKHRWQKVVCVLAAIVVFVTTYILILPAITLEIDQWEEIGWNEVIKTAMFGTEESPKPADTTADGGTTDATDAAVTDNGTAASVSGIIADSTDDAATDTTAGTADETAAEGDTSAQTDTTDDTTDTGATLSIPTALHAFATATPSLFAEQTETEDTTADTATDATADASNTATATETESGVSAVSETETETESGVSAASGIETESGISTASDTEDGIMTLSDEDDDTTAVTIKAAQKVIRYANRTDSASYLNDTEVTFADIANADLLDDYKFMIGGAAVKYSSNGGYDNWHWGTYHALTTTTKKLGFANNFSTKFTSLAAYCKNTDTYGYDYITNGETNSGYLTADKRTANAIWYFEASGDSTYPYYIYTYNDDESKSYLKMTAETGSYTGAPTASLSLVSDKTGATPFSLSNDFDYAYKYANANNNAYMNIWKNKETAYPLNIKGKITTDSNGSTIDAAAYYLGAYYGNNAGSTDNAKIGYYSQHGFAGITERIYNTNNDTYLVGIDLFIMSDPQPGDFTIQVANPDDGQVTLTWTTSGDATAYYITVKDADGNVVQDEISVGKSVTHTVTGLTNGTTYTFEVRAHNKRGDKTATTTATPRAPLFTELKDLETLDTLDLTETAFTVAGADIRKLTDGTYVDYGSYHIMTADNTGTMTTDGVDFTVLKPYCYSASSGTTRGDDTQTVTNANIENYAIWYFEKSGDDTYPYYIITIVNTGTDDDPVYTKEYLSITTDAGSSSINRGINLVTKRRSAVKFKPEIETLTNSDGTTVNLLRLKDENGYYLASYYSDYGWAKHAFSGTMRTSSESSTSQTAEINKETGATDVSLYYCGALRLCYMTKEMPRYDTSTYAAGQTITLNLTELTYNATSDTTSYNTYYGAKSFVSSSDQTFDKYSDVGTTVDTLTITDAVRRTATDGTVTYLISNDEIDTLKASADSRYLEGSVYRYGLTKFYKCETYNGQEYDYSDWFEVQTEDIDNADDDSARSYTVYYPLFEEANDTVTPAGTVISMYDYWTAGDTEDYRFVTDMDGNTPVSQRNTGINSNESNYKFFKGGDWTGLPMNNYTGNTTFYTSTYKSGKYKAFANLPVQGIAANVLGSDGYPFLNGAYNKDSTDDTAAKGCELVGYKVDSDGSYQTDSDGNYVTNDSSLKYLFDSDTAYAGKKSFKNIKNLFRIDDDGYYYFSSRERFAQFNEKTNSFIEYKTPGVYHNSLYGQFFPYNTMAEAYNKCSDSATDSPVEDGYYDGLNHYLAISMKAAFTQDNAGHVNSLPNAPETTFEFERGDDFWLYIDGVLIGDAGGLHPVSHVTINFATGVVSQYNKNNTSYKCENTTIYQLYKDAGVEDQYSWITTDDGDTIYADDTEHTLIFYCLERGNGESNLMLKYNLSEKPESLVHKVDQYGNDLEGATFAFYATNNSYEYRDDDGKYVALSNYENTAEYKVDIDESDGKISCYKQSGTDSETGDPVYSTTAEFTITPKYSGTTDNNGELKLIDEEGLPMSISDLMALIGEDQCIMREIYVPDGYRTIEDEAELYVENGRLFSNNIYESGVWCSNKVQVTATGELHPVSDSKANNLEHLYADDDTDEEDDLLGTDGIYKTIKYFDNVLNTSTGKYETKLHGTLFAVVLRRSVTNSYDDDGTRTQTFGNYAQRNKENASETDWVPVYGTDEVGYTREASYSMETVIDAAQRQAAYNSDAPENVFTNNAGNINMTLKSLPGKASAYYCNQRALAGNDPGAMTTKQQDSSHYIIAYYWTSASSLDDATADNTYRISSFSEDASGDDTKISNTYSITELQKDWAATITVSNFENKLNVQKLDLDEIPVNGTTFALYNAGQDDHPTKEYEEDTKTTVDVKHTYYIAQYGAREIKVYLKPSEDNPNTGIAYIGGYGNGENGESNEADYTGTYEIAEITGSIYDTDGSVKDDVGDIIVTYNDVSNDVTLTIEPARNAEGDFLVTTTHTCTSDCDTHGEYGTGHFNMLQQGSYLLREISAPKGYGLNSAQTQVLVDEDDVYANAGTSDNDISVGNGTGYVENLLIKKTDSQSANYLYGLLNVISGDTTFDDVSRSAFKSDTYVKANSYYDKALIDTADKKPETTEDKKKAMVMYLDYAGDSDEEVSYDYERNDIDYFDPDNNGVRTWTTGYGFAGHTVTGGGIKPIDPTSRRDKPDGTGGDTDTGDTGNTDDTGDTGTGDTGNTGDTIVDIKAKHPRMYTDAGWTAISLFQDYEYGHLVATDYYYDDLRAQQTISANSVGDISNLFSHSTFVRVQDESIAEVRIIKTDKTSDNKPGTTTLKDASFILTRTKTEIEKFDTTTTEETDDDGNTATTTTTTTVDGDTVTEYWTGEIGDDGYAKWSTNIEYAKTLTTGSDGTLYDEDTEAEVFFGGLPDLPTQEKAIEEEESKYGYGYYTLTETESPDGYKPLTGVITFSVWRGSAKDTTVPANSGVDVRTDDDEDTGNRIIQVTVPNEAGTILPSTGGMGNAPFIIIGAAITAAALTALTVTRKKRRTT